MEIESKYLDSSVVKVGDFVVFLDAGEKGEIEQRDGTVKPVYNFGVETNGKRYIYTPNSKSLKFFISAWGRNTDVWVGKKFGVNLVTIEVAGKEMVVIRPVILDVKV